MENKVDPTFIDNSCFQSSNQLFYFLNMTMNFFCFDITVEEALIMGNCLGKSLKGPRYRISERHMEVDGKLFIEREETTITMDAYGKKTTQIEVTWRTIAVGEKTCRVIVESDEGNSKSVTYKIGLTPAETEAFLACVYF